jgi:hypothetical protein
MAAARKRHDRARNYCFHCSQRGRCPFECPLGGPRTDDPVRSALSSQAPPSVVSSAVSDVFPGNNRSVHSVKTVDASIEKNTSPLMRALNSPSFYSLDSSSVAVSVDSMPPDACYEAVPPSTTSPERRTPAINAVASVFRRNDPPDRWDQLPSEDPDERWPAFPLRRPVGSVISPAWPDACTLPCSGFARLCRGSFDEREYCPICRDKGLFITVRNFDVLLIDSVE